MRRLCSTKRPNQTDRTTVTCDVEPETYPGVWQDSDEIIRHALEDTRSGSIILLHVMYPSRSGSLVALPEIITGLREKGFEFVTLREILRGGRPGDLVRSG
jgi:peptidoglycan/xylan/chitin deacetylase (PgdA/CDA1 family)